MAEFKLGRIRFVWKNTWSSSTTYYIDDVVRHGGRTYISAGTIPYHIINVIDGRWGPCVFPNKSNST